MFNYHCLDNLCVERGNVLEPKRATQIAEFLQCNVRASNNATYSPEEVERFARTFTPEWIAEQAQRGYLIYATDERDAVIASGMIVRDKGVLKGRYWNVDQDHRGSSLALGILRRFDRKLRDIDAKDLYFGAFKFPETLEIYRRLGCEELPQETGSGSNFDGLFVLMRLNLATARAALKNK
jgi:hypothetical protein